jgi:pyruvate/2-oxoglutarate dehydrogenase complex dihydrolipoamide dehydrogenase (E3) component
LKTAIVERHLMGETCVNTGCLKANTKAKLKAIQTWGCL